MCACFTHEREVISPNFVERWAISFKFVRLFHVSQGGRIFQTQPIITIVAICCTCFPSTSGEHLPTIDPSSIPHPPQEDYSTNH